MHASPLKKVYCSASRACQLYTLHLPDSTGMIVVCVFAYKEGDLSKLIYGTDSHGFICGKSYSFLGTSIDLTNRKALYYLDPLEVR